MGYLDFYRITNIVDPQKRLIEFAHYYKKQKIDGLHYVNFYTDTNTVSISKPDHSTHHEATSFLIDAKNSGYSINTVRSFSQHLKKFLDFLMLWDMEDLNGDLLIILTGFVDYLRVIETKKQFLPQNVIEWSMFQYIPLHIEARSLGMVSTITLNKQGIREVSKWGQISAKGMSKIISGCLTYLEFIYKRSNKYGHINLSDIPLKVKYSTSILSGTIGPNKTDRFDINFILRKANVNTKSSTSVIEPFNGPLFRTQELNQLLNSMDHNDRQNRFLFQVLKGFGVREAEAANLQIDNSSLPTNLLKMDIFEAGDYIKKHLKGDIEFTESIDKWVCYVANRNSPTNEYSSRNKSAYREVPLLFSQEEFTSLFLNALKERELYFRRYKRNHPYIFISKSGSYSGREINGRSIYSKYKNVAEKHLKKTGIDLTQYSPHTFRHYFATYLLRTLKKDIEDVSRWLGHSDVKITRTTYIHYLPDDDIDGTPLVRDISDTFRKN